MNTLIRAVSVDFNGVIYSRYSFPSRRRLIAAVQDVRFQTASGDRQESDLPPQDSLGSWVAKARTLAQQCCVALQQLSWVLQCCPEGSAATMCQSREGDGGQGEATLSHPTPLSAHLQPPVCLMRRGEASWTEAVKSLEVLQSESTQLKERLNTLGHESTRSAIQTRLDSEPRRDFLTSVIVEHYGVTSLTNHTLGGT